MAERDKMQTALDGCHSYQEQQDRTDEDPKKQVFGDSTTQSSLSMADISFLSSGLYFQIFQILWTELIRYNMYIKSSPFETAPDSVTSCKPALSTEAEEPKSDL